MSGIIDNLPDDLTPYERGWIDGVYTYAHMVDGTYYVGTTGRKMDDAIRAFLRQDRAVLQDDEPLTPADRDEANIGLGEIDGSE